MSDKSKLNSSLKKPGAGFSDDPPTPNPPEPRFPSTPRGPVDPPPPPSPVDPPVPAQPYDPNLAPLPERETS